MDKIDSFVIHGKQKLGEIEFTFLLVEEDIKAWDREHIIDYIDVFTHNLNKKFPQFTFSWEAAHKIKPMSITEEIIHQILVQR